MSRWLLKKHSFGNFKFHLLILIAVELLLVGGWAYLKPLRDRAEFGYIVKQGNHYLVLWKTDNKEQFMMEVSDLKSAIEFAKVELELDLAHDRLASYPLEASWLSPNLGGVAFYWKTANFEFFNRLTFSSFDEAQLFQRLVKGGAYSPSPAGHSLALFPVAKNSQ